VAHGGRFRGKRVGLERYAQFVQSFFPEYQPAPPSLKQEPMPLGPEPPRPTRKQASTQPERPAVADPTKVIPTRPSSRSSTSKPATKIAPAPQSRARLNPGLALTMILLLIITCVAGMTLVQTENRAANPTAPTIAPPAPPLPTIAGIETRITSDALNLRSEPGINGPILAMMPAGATVILLDQGPTRDGHVWVRVRFGEIEGWADSTFLQQP
jgi:hypothetical protein